MLDRIFIVLESDKRPILVVRLQDIVPSQYIPVPPGLDKPTTSACEACGLKSKTLRREEDTHYQFRYLVALETLSTFPVIGSRTYVHPAITPDTFQSLIQMQTHNASKNGLRLAIIAFVTLGIAASGTVSTMQYASAASMANLWAVPVNSRVDDGNYQIVRLKFELDTGNPLEKTRITVDAGTPDEKVLEFNANGDILTADPAFVSVDGSIKIKTDGYVLTKLSGKYKIAIDKAALGVGEHDALAEIITTGETVTDDAHFRLRAGSSGQADLVAKFFGAPDNVKQDKKTMVFVKEANEGTGNAGEHTIAVYLSEDNVLDGSDLLVGEKDVENLKKGKDRMVPVQIELPDDAETGPAFLIVKVDGEDEIAETNEGNNSKSESITVVEWTDAFAN